MPWICSCSRSWKSDDELCSKTAYRKEGGWRGMISRPSTLWQKCADKLYNHQHQTNVIPTGEKTAKTPAHTDTATNDDVVPEKTSETPLDPREEPTTSCEKAAADGTGKHDSHRSLSKIDLAESFGNMFANQSSRKIVDIAVRKSAGGLLHRRAILNTESSQSYMAGDVYRALGIEKFPYQEPSVVEPGEKEVTPLGQVKAEWHLATNREKTYTSLFLIIETEDFDFSLGNPLIREHQLREAVGTL